MNNKEVKILEAKDILEIKISKYLESTYKNRTTKISLLWKWLYRCYEYNFKSSYLAVFKEKIIGHAGSIPTKIIVNKKIVEASWFVDFTIDENMRNFGIGKQLTSKWMKENKIGLTFCNDQSARVFKKFGWNETYKSYMHYFFIKPFDHQKFKNYFNYIKFIKFFLNLISKVIFTIIYYNLSSKKLVLVEKLTSKNIESFNNTIFINNSFNISTLRDENYLNWKFIESPEYNLYRKFTNNNMSSCIVKIRKDKINYKHLDLLLIADDLTESNKIELIADVVYWSARNNFSYVRLHSSIEKETTKIQKKFYSVVRKNRFVFFVDDEILKKSLEKSELSWQLYDSDLDVIS